MRTKLQKIVAGLVATVALVVGFAVAPVGSLPSSVGTQHAAACSDNVYQVQWSYAGVYRGQSPQQVGTMQYGQRIHGYHGGSYVQYIGGFGWATSVYYGPYLDTYMHSESLAYIGCQ